MLETCDPEVKVPGLQLFRCSKEGLYRFGKTVEGREAECSHHQGAGDDEQQHNDL